MVLFLVSRRPDGRAAFTRTLKNFRRWEEGLTIIRLLVYSDDLMTLMMDRPITTEERERARSVDKSPYCDGAIAQMLEEA